MRLHRFFIEKELQTGRVETLSDSDLCHQLRQVFRLRVGDKVLFFNGSGFDYETEIVSLDRKEVSYNVLEKHLVEYVPRVKLTLAFSLIKKDNVEWIIQKGTELGVLEFIPLVSERSEKKGFNMERAKKIMIEAAEQSGRADIPQIHEPQNLSDFLSYDTSDEKRKIVCFHTVGEKFVRNNFSDSNIVACVGPEGGWSEKESSLFKEKGASVVLLDAPVLRAETAAVAVATLFLLF